MSNAASSTSSASTERLTGVAFVGFPDGAEIINLVEMTEPQIGGGTFMSRQHLHPEAHLVSRIGWLRAAVLGANDGIVSTASLIVGVAAASAATSEVLVAGVAGLVAGAMPMAAGEYVSVSSQSDTERADLARERAELASQPEFEREELARIYVDRGVSPELAQQVVDQLMARDALGPMRATSWGFPR